MTELLGFLDVPVRVVATRTAEALKYSCNAFHAAKVSFTNELSPRLPATRNRFARGDGHLLYRRPVEHLPQLPAAGIRIRWALPR